MESKLGWARASDLESAPLQAFPGVWEPVDVTGGRLTGSWVWPSPEEVNAQGSPDNHTQSPVLLWKSHSVLCPFLCLRVPYFQHTGHQGAWEDLYTHKAPGRSVPLCHPLSGGLDLGPLVPPQAGAQSPLVPWGSAGCSSSSGRASGKCIYIWQMPI